eukprot:TRINITY_DN1704_c0_g1_i1.p1 TRINITY_DN1704_c0_g1~~TRINITY_DN1704_c0_g1_i1.p1  ORF type:complete len:138 (-),score=24.90 TRINITY_DN1704_c0_g1_i1:36-449(-)
MQRLTRIASVVRLSSPPVFQQRGFAHLKVDRDGNPKISVDSTVKVDPLNQGNEKTLPQDKMGENTANPIQDTTSAFASAENAGANQYIEDDKKVMRVYESLGYKYSPEDKLGINQAEQTFAPTNSAGANPKIKPSKG